MNNTHNITIVLLVICAVVLTSILVATYSSTSQQAYAYGSSREGQYIMAPMSYQPTDMVFVIDIANQRLIAYMLDERSNTVSILDTVDLEQVFTRQ